TGGPTRLRDRCSNRDHGGGVAGLSDQLLCRLADVESGSDARCGQITPEVHEAVRGAELVGKHGDLPGAVHVLAPRIDVDLDVHVTQTGGQAVVGDIDVARRGRLTGPRRVLHIQLQGTDGRAGGCNDLDAEFLGAVVIAVDAEIPQRARARHRDGGGGTAGGRVDLAVDRGAPIVARRLHDDPAWPGERCDPGFELTRAVVRAVVGPEREVDD